MHLRYPESSRLLVGQKRPRMRDIRRKEVINLIVIITITIRASHQRALHGTNLARQADLSNFCLTQYREMGARYCMGYMR